MSGTDKTPGTTPPSVEKPGTEKPGAPAKHTDQGAPTDAAHQDAGDGYLTGSTPAGLTVDELLEQANSNKPSDGGGG